MKKLLEQLKENVVEPRKAIEAMVPMNERWGRLSMLSSMDQRVATLQFDSCAEKDRLCGRVVTV